MSPGKIGGLVTMTARGRRLKQVAAGADCVQEVAQRDQWLPDDPQLVEGASLAPERLCDLMRAAGVLGPRDERDLGPPGGNGERGLVWVPVDTLRDLRTRRSFARRGTHPSGGHRKIPRSQPKVATSDHLQQPLSGECFYVI